MKVPRRAWLTLALLAVGCELQEVQLAESEDLVIAEVVLRTGAPNQVAWLHRTRGSAHKDPLVENATVRVYNASNAVLELRPAADESCIIARDDTEPETHGSCYASGIGGMPVQPGQTYRLSVVLPDGRTLTGSTTVPNDFQMLRPATSVCSVPALTPFDVSWSISPGAWVYAAETSLRGIRAALEPHNVSVDRDPLRLFGLSLSARDTSIAFPAEFGLFDRFDEDLVEVLTFLQRGLPEGVIAGVVIAAADRNYVNWERGGNFNPSGPVRVPSVHGDGTGVFGALVPKAFQVRVAEPERTPC
ncbi:MAG: DUF4249 family protein [Longimicrobiales bacterium]